MKLSIITVNLNNASGLETTMRSVFEQIFSDYEYIIIDGGSTDGSRDVIERNQKRLSYWVSESDTGIYNAMNKAIRVAKGEYLYFLNSGDTLCGPDVLSRVFDYNPKADVIIGRINFTDSGGTYHSDYQPRCRTMTPQDFYRTGVPHQASFIKRELFEEFGLYDETFKISADWKFFLQALVIGKSSFKYIPVTVANFDGQGISSKNNRLMMEEIDRAYRELVSEKTRMYVPVKKRITKLLSELKNFGLLHILRVHIFARIHKCNCYQQKVVYKYLYKKYSNLICDSDSVGNMENKFPVWVCWLQGLDSMPMIVRRCYHSIVEHFGIERVTLLTSENIDGYVHIPDYVRDLYIRGRMTAAHYSDIVRFSILKAYGGLWIDATMLVSGLPDFNGMPFYSIKGACIDDKYVSKYRWAGYCVGGAAGNALFVNLEKLLLAYWKDHDRIIDYFLMDYLILLVYEKNTSVRQLIDSVPLNNPDVSFLQFHFDEPFDQEIFDRICSTTCLHKLSWKGDHSAVTADGGETYYGHILGMQAEQC